MHVHFVQALLLLCAYCFAALLSYCLPAFLPFSVRLLRATVLPLLHPIGLEDSNFTLRFQLFADRTQPSPSRLLADLAAGAAACAASPVAVGLNLVGPEAHPSALAHYWLHMQLLRALRHRWHGLRLALHAGELSHGQVRRRALWGPASSLCV